MASEAAGHRPLSHEGIARRGGMTDKPQYSVTFLPCNEVRFWSLSRKAKVKPEYRPMGAERYHSQAAAMFAVTHYKETGRILLHEEVKTTLRRSEEHTSELPSLRHLVC